MDLSDLLNTNASGLLSPAQQGDVNGQTLQGLAAGLLKASAPSPFKARMTTLSGIGEGLQGALNSRRAATDDLLKQQLVKSQIGKNTNDQLLPALQMAAQYQANGLPVPPQLQTLLQRIGGGLAPAAGGGLPGGGAMAQAPGGAPMPQVGGGQPMQAPGAPGAAPQSAPGQDLIMQTAHELGINPMRVMMKDPTALKAIEERIHANDPALEESERRKKIMAGDVERSDKLYPALVSLGQQGATAKQDAQLSAALVKDPGFFSGSGQPLNEAWKRLQVSLGGDPNAAFSQEAFRKITASGVNTQIGEMKATAAEMGGAAGRIFQNQTVLMEKASQNLDNTPAANKFLATLQERAADMNVKVSDMAIEYKQKHGILDAGFDKQLSKYTADNPLVTKAELANVRQLTGMPSPQPAAAAGPAPVPGSPAGAAQAAPALPAGVTRVSTPGEAAQLPKGSRYMAPDGKIRIIQ